MPSSQPTISDVAKVAGVSRQTVSRVINAKGEITAETRARVQAVIDDLGYRPNVMASSLAGGRSRNVGLVVTNPADEVPTNPFFLSVIYGAGIEAQKRNHGLVVKYASADEVLGHLDNIFARGQVDGIVILRAHRDFAPAFGHRTKSQLPILLIGDFEEECGCPSLDIDNATGSKLLGEHLLSHGYRRIAIVCHSPAGHASADSRVRGMFEALRGGPVCVEPRPIIWTDSTLVDAYAKTRSLLAGGEIPEAIFATNDWAAMAVLRAVRDAGLRVPEDIAVVGFDDIPLAGYLDPPLTTASFSGFELGREALGRLLDYIESDDPPRSSHLPTQLVIRRSCGCPGDNEGPTTV
jgi:LacI family transcriptional regulator